MLKFWNLPLDAIIGSVEAATKNAAATSDGILGTFASIFTSGFNIITDNPALFAILCVAVGAPILGVVISLFKGR